MAITYEEIIKKLESLKNPSNAEGVARFGIRSKTKVLRIPIPEFRKRTTKKLTEEQAEKWMANNALTGLTGEAVKKKVKNKKNMKIFLKFFVLIIVVVVLVYIFFYSTELLFAPSAFQTTGNKVCFASNCFLVELAKTEAEREGGLMYREKLDINRGMFFIFDKEAFYPFWMKNTLIPLDIIWIGENNKVAFISENTLPCPPVQNICPSTNPSKEAKYVLEINAGLVKKFRIKIGDEITF